MADIRQGVVRAVAKQARAGVHVVVPVVRAIHYPERRRSTCPRGNVAVV